MSLVSMSQENEMNGIDSGCMQTRESDYMLTWRSHQVSVSISSKNKPLNVYAVLFNSIIFHVRTKVVGNTYSSFHSRQR
jgi:hypothetical protein